MLSYYVNQNHNNWHELLPFIVFCQNTSYHNSTKSNAYKLLYGRDAKLPIDIQLNRKEIISYNNSDNREIEFLEKLNKARNIAKIHIKNAQQKYSFQYNKNRKEISYKIGDLVLLNRPGYIDYGLTKHFIPKFSGPYKITSIISKLNYEITALKPDKNVTLTMVQLH